MTTDAQIEQEIQSKGLTAARVTPQQIEDQIREEYCFTAAAALKGTPGELSEPCKLLTICVLVLKNGFTVTGESACRAAAATICRFLAWESRIDARTADIRTSPERSLQWHPPSATGAT